MSLYQRASAANPQSAPTFLNLGLLLDQLGRTSEAEPALRRATELDPTLATPLTAAPTPDSSPDSPGDSPGDSSGTG